MTLIRRCTGNPPRTALPKGAIDTQVHLYLPGFPARPGGPPLPAGDLPGPDQYRSVMRWLGIGRVVITQGNAHQTDNANLLACLREMGDIARGVAVITPETPAAEMEALAAAGVVGARIMDLPGGAVGLDRLEAIDARAADIGWMLAIQFNGSALPDLAPRLARLRSRWVLDHHGKFLDGAGPAHLDALRRLIDGGRTWFKLAGCYEASRLGPPDYADVAAISRAIAAHAPERIVWGTNWPHNLIRTTEAYPDDARLADTVLGWLPDAAALGRALVTNPEELYGFPPSSDPSPAEATP